MLTCRKDRGYRRQERPSVQRHLVLTSRLPLSGGSLRQRSTIIVMLREKQDDRERKVFCTNGMFQRDQQLLTEIPRALFSAITTPILPKAATKQQEDVLAGNCGEYFCKRYTPQ